MPAAPCFRSLALVAALSLSGVTAMAADTPSEPSVSDRLASARRSIEAKDWRGAQRELTAALRDEPRNADVHDLLGSTARKSDPPDMPKAFEHYKRALELNPRHLGAHEYIGKAYLMVNQPDTAKTHLAQLAALCGNTTCEMYQELDKAIQAYQAKKP